jgi:hypothetical protein
MEETAMSMTEMRGRDDLRGYHTAGPEEATSKSKLLAAAAVVLGVVAVGAYAYTSHSLLPSAPVHQTSAASQPVAMTPPVQPATTQPDAATSAPQATPAPEVQTPAPEAKTAAPRTILKAKPVSTVKAKLTAHTTTVKTAPQTQQSATPSQTVTPGITSPNTDTATPYTAAPSTTTPQNTAPDNTMTQQPQTQQPTTPDQSALQTQSPQ